MPCYKLTYFNFKGRGELCRLVFKLAGAEFEDNRIDRAKWDEFKPSVKSGFLPVLEFDGVQYGQSRAIATYLAKEFGFFGSNNIDALKIDVVLSTIDDFIQAAMKVFYAKEDEMEAKVKEFKEEAAPNHLANLERMLKESGTGYFLGDSITLADLACFDFVSGIETRNPGCLDSYPSVKALLEKVGNNDKIKAWVETRPVTML